VTVVVVVGTSTATVVTVVVAVVVVRTTIGGRISVNLARVTMLSLTRLVLLIVSMILMRVDLKPLRVRHHDTGLTLFGTKKALFDFLLVFVLNFHEETFQSFLREFVVGRCMGGLEELESIFEKFQAACRCTVLLTCHSNFELVED